MQNIICGNRCVKLCWWGFLFWCSICECEETAQLSTPNCKIVETHDRYHDAIMWFVYVALVLVVRVLDSGALSRRLLLFPHSCRWSFPCSSVSIKCHSFFFTPDLLNVNVVLVFVCGRWKQWINRTVLQTKHHDQLLESIFETQHKTTTTKCTTKSDPLFKDATSRTN